ncbi:MAG: 4'-phosphopantetheinyl transferase superfamily protein [Clostridia bacterium]|nr:4'-phosphopantetheinyl transferase superfamily protein [Clostridia bacterium]
MVVICSLMPLSYTKEELWAIADEARVFERFGKGERNRINKISKDTTAALSLGGLIALSRAIDRLGIECGELTIHRDSFGKPRFLRDGAPAFSIAHAGGISVAAISLGGASVGIDIERIDEGRDTLRISDKFFSASEKEMLSAAEDKLFEFYRIWTAKEALMKHGGEGMISVMSADSTHSACVFSHYPISFENDKYILTLCADGKEEIVFI